MAIKTLPMPQQGSFMDLINDYIALMKPRIIFLLLFTTIGAMVMADEGMPSIKLIIFTMIAGALSAGGSGAINHFMDKDIDRLMARTRGRPVANERVSPRNALVFGITLMAIAFVLFALGANMLSAVLSLIGGLFYVFVYTKWLKRSSTQNIVIGGAAGAIPPLVGWAAVTGSLALPAWYMFAIVFFWTPPHFWALSLLLKDDYAAANVPMLPVIVGEPETRRMILLYTVVVVLLTAAFTMASELLGWIYLSTIVVTGAYFIFTAVRLVRKPDRRSARKVFFYSMVYLGAVFLAIMVDSAV